MTPRSEPDYPKIGLGVFDQDFDLYAFAVSGSERAGELLVGHHRLASWASRRIYFEVKSRLNLRFYLFLGFGVINDRIPAASSPQSDR